LLNYDVIDLRLLDRSTGRLVPLLEEGMLPKAMTIELYAKEEGNGVTGYVAATGKTYLCRDTAAEPRYIEGAAGAKSSLTVPLLLGDEVIGTLNIESPQVDAFTETDVTFTEAFAREIAQALHTLELLRVEKSGTASASVEAVSREVAQPADDILNTASGLLCRTPPTEADTIEQLRRIITSVRSIKQSIRSVGQSLAPPRVANAREASLAESLHGKYVLVADNDERVRKAAHVLLEKYGCHVETARSGQEAIDMAQADHYDAFLMDIRLPEGSAYATYRRLRDLQPNARPVLMAGFGYDSSHVLVKARQEGCVAVLFKPFRNDQVLDALAGPAPTPQPAVP
jgi:CheY-like chemotaxis protein